MNRVVVVTVSCMLLAGMSIARTIHHTAPMNDCPAYSVGAVHYWNDEFYIPENHQRWSSHRDVSLKASRIDHRFKKCFLEIYFGPNYHETFPNADIGSTYSVTYNGESVTVELRQILPDPYRAGVDSVVSTVTIEY